MSKLSKLARISIALGGFLIFLGVLMIVVCALAFYKFVRIPDGAVFIWFLLVISLLNLLGGLLLRRNCR